MSPERAHLGLARKFRPQGFEEVVGQEAVATTLKNALTAGKPAHAYLFFGPRGVGKTTSARILAKALNCKKGVSPEPCGKCPSCEEIARSSSVDVLELDAATNTQVDRIREMIIETVSLAPSRDRFKIFIIDEVHMLSTASFNALLKTLEEPPPHVVFILATTDPGKIPPTIVSRCQRFRFRPVALETMEAHLSRVAKAEGIAIEPEALRLLSQAASGALRDALSLLEQAHAYAGGKIGAKTVRELLGILPEDLLESLAQAILARDAATLSKLLEKVWEEGFDAAQLLRDLRERLRLAYLHRLGVSGHVAPKWKAISDPHSPETFSFLIQRMNKALDNLRAAESPHLSLELSIFGMIEAAYDFREWARRLEALESRLGSAPGPLPEPAGPALPVRLVRAQPAEKAALPAEADEPETPAPVVESGSARDVWNAVLKLMEQDAPGLATDLRAARLIAAENGPWKLVFARAFDADRAKRHEKKIEDKLTTVRGRPAQITFDVDPSVANEAADEAGKPDVPEAGPQAPDPAVQRVLQVFPGKVRTKKQ